MSHINSNSSFQSRPLPPLVEESFDVEWENTLQRDPYDVELWLEYASDKTRRGLSQPAIAMVYERALAKLPGSYKLWNTYLNLRRGWITESPAKPGSLLVEGLNATFERCLIFMNKMPKIWLAYCNFLVEQRALTIARRTFDRALRALPSTQHVLIWDAYTQFALSVSELPWQTAERILKRRCRVDPDEGRAALVEFLKSRNRFGEAARELVDILGSANEEESKKQVRAELSALVRSYPDECRTFVDFEKVCRAIPKELSEERVKTFTSLADYLIRLGNFDQSREIFEQVMSQECSDSIRNFSTVFEMYSKFEEAILDEAEANNDNNELRLRTKRMRHLLERRTRISSEVVLKAWPGDVQQRLAFARFFQKQGNHAKMQSTILDAFPATESLELINGRGSDMFLWLAEAERLRLGEDIEADALIKAQDQILALGCHSSWELKDIVDLWRARIELRLAHGKHDRALKLAIEAITPPPSPSNEKKSNGLHEEETSTVKKRPFHHRSPLLWSLYLDLEENFGTFESARAAYEQAMEIKVCSVWMVLNYCKLLRKRDYHEDSYVVFERAVSMFPWPHVKDLWIEYTKQFVERYAGTKVERTRDLFEQCIKSIPESNRHHSEFAFYGYAKFEEVYGLSRRAMAVYERWVDFVQEDQKCDAYLMWATKAEELFGAPTARKIYEKAVGTLPELDIARICIRFADVERRLGELERARALYKHGSQFTDPVDPKKDVGLWQAWNEFEVKNGNEETFREMLRVKRSVQVHYSILHAADSVTMKSSSAATTSVASAAISAASGTSTTSTAAAIHEQVDATSQYIDPSEIDIDDEEAEPEQSSVNDAANDETKKHMGALERLKAAAQARIGGAAS